MRRTKGFTLVELLVVIGIIALLVSILMPALGRARELAKRIQCASQQNGIGKAIALYQNEYRDANPRPWRGSGLPWGFGGDGSNSNYGNTDWCNTHFYDPTDGIDPTHMGDHSTVGQCLFLLIRVEDLEPQMYICPSATDDKEMLIEDAIAANPYQNSGISTDRIETWQDCYDFMDGHSLSYSFNDPWNRPLDSSASAAQALLADKSNAYDTPDFSPNPVFASLHSPVPNGTIPAKGATESWGGVTWDDDEGNNLQHGNSKNHQTEVQNVMFADTHTKKFTTPLVGKRQDNIYTFATEASNADWPYQIGQWGFSGNLAPPVTNGGMYFSDDPIFGPDDTDSYLGN